MEAVAGGILGELTIDKAWIWVTSILLYPVFNRYVTEGLDRWQEGVDWLFSYTTLEVHETALVGNNWKDPAFEDIMLWLDVDLQKSTFRHLRVSEGEHGVDHFSLVPGSQYGTGLYVKHHLSRSRRVRLVFTLLEDEVGGNPDYGHASSKKCRLQVKVGLCIQHYKQNRTNSKVKLITLDCYLPLSVCCSCKALIARPFMSVDTL